MKFEIKDENNEEKIVKLSLEEKYNSIFLMATNKTGEKWGLMEFNNGKFKKLYNFPSNIGVDVDDNGSIIEDN
jgi:hypothetical protein